jgi:hypothetical protein
VGLERLRSWWSDPADPPGPGRAAALETALLAALVLLLLTLALWLWGSFSLFDRIFWFDEGLTQTIVADPDFLHSMRALAGGVETHPPTYYILLRGVVTVLGRADEVALRWFAFLCTVAGLVGVYATLRFAYPPVASLAAVLALGAHPLLLKQGFEARHYNLLLAEAAWFCYFLLRSRVPGARAGPLIGLVSTAILLVTTHYFGIICLVLILAGDTLFGSHSTRARRCRAIALAAGVAALAACVPMLRSQRAAISVATWVPLPDIVSIREMFRALFVPLLVVVVLASGAGVLTLLRFRRREPEPATAVAEPGSMAGLVGLAALPAVLLVMSYVYQPVFVDRYALPAVLALAPLVAWLCTWFPRWLAVAVCAGLWIVSGLEMHYLAEDYRSRDMQRAQFIGFLREKCEPDAPIAFHTPIRLSWVMRYAPDLAPRCYQLDFDWADLDAGVEAHFFSRDLARQEAAYYGRPRLLSCRDMNLPLAYVVFDQQDVLPHFRPFALARQRYLGLGLYELRFGQSAGAPAP